MKHVKYYKDFLNDDFYPYSENQLQISLFNGILNNYNIDKNIKSEIYNFLNENLSLNENYFNKFKEFILNSSQKTDKISNSAKNIIKEILKKSKDSLSLIKRISGEIKLFFKKIIEKTKKAIGDKLKLLKKEINQIYKTKKDGLLRDVKTIKSVLDFYRKEFISNFISKVQKNLVDLFSSESGVTESLILEKNIISKLFHKITHIPPFSYLEELAKFGELGATKFIEKLSNFTNKLGGPTFTLPVIALIIGELFEYVIKGQVVGVVSGIEILSDSGLEVVLKGIKNIATVISILAVIDAVVGQKLLGPHEENETSKDI